MKSRDFYKEIKGLGKEALIAEAKKMGEEAMKLRFKKASKQLTNSAYLQVLKKNIARINTVLSSINK